LKIKDKKGSIDNQVGVSGAINLLIINEKNNSIDNIICIINGISRVL